MVSSGADHPGSPAGLTAVSPQTPLASLATRLDKHVFKSVRDDADRLNSSPLELCVRLRGRLAAEPPDVHVEILYSDGQVPVCYVEAVGGMRPVDNPGCTVSVDGASMTVRVERNFPLSSSHCGRPFLLALVLDGAHVLTTTPFFVMAKAPKSGTTLKPRTPKVPRAVSSAREAAMAAIRGSGAAGPAGGLFVLSVASDGGSSLVGAGSPLSRGVKHAPPAPVEAPPQAKRPRRRCRKPSPSPPPSPTAAVAAVPSPTAALSGVPRLPSPYMGGMHVPLSPGMFTPTMGGLLAPAGALPSAFALPTAALTAELLKDFGTLSPLADMLGCDDAPSGGDGDWQHPASPCVVLPTELPQHPSTTVLSALSC